MKLMKALVVLLVAAGLIVPAAAIAEDRLKLSGEMRVRAFHTDYDFDGDTDDSTDTWANQRLRIAGTLAVAEGVSVTFRTDITEGTNWGDHSGFGGGPGNPERSNGFGSGRSGSQQQWDRAHLDLTGSLGHLRAGQLYFGTFGTFAIDTQDNGLVYDNDKLGFKTEAFFIVDRNNDTSAGYSYPTSVAGGGVPVLTTSQNEHDGFLYGVGIQPKGDNFSSRLYVASQNSALNQDEEVYLILASGSTNLGAVKLFGEVDYFTGDASDTLDAMGLQLFVDASMAASDSLNVGAQLFYAQGDDEDAQYTGFGNGFNGWDPVMDVGTSLSNEEIPLGNPFNFSGLNAGVIGGRLYADTKMGATKLGASVAYLTTEEDDMAEVDAVALAAGLVYDILPNASFQVQLQYTDGTVDSILDVDVDDGDFDAFEAGTGIFVKF